MIGWFKRNGNKGYGCWRGRKVDAQNPPSAVSLLEIGHIHNASSLAYHATVSTNHEIPMDTMFEQDLALIEMVNSDSASSWKATKHKRFSNRPLKQMMSMLGRRQYRKARRSARAHMDERSDEEKYGDLPEEWDWRNVDGVNYMDEVVDQGFCGSCYAMATVSAMTARFRIASKDVDSPLLSAQNILGCSRTNQGCDGGYPYLAVKYGEDFGFVAETCDKYKDDDVQQGTCTNKKECAQKRFFATNYEYVGGYYGGCGEVAMMEEIMENGPVMVAFEAPVSLFYYHGGIFTGPDPAKEEKNTATQWEHTNHAVVAVGWGVDYDKPDPKNNGAPMKYWIIKNTWGDDWGENGYFKIRRSTDECGIESMAVTAEAVVDGSFF
jgi:cathepsin C